MFLSPRFPFTAFAAGAVLVEMDVSCTPKACLADCRRGTQDCLNPIDGVLSASAHVDVDIGRPKPPKSECRFARSCYRSGVGLCSQNSTVVVRFHWRRMITIHGMSSCRGEVFVSSPKFVLPVQL